MPASGPTFTDWEQVEADSHRPLLVEDFSWSEPPARRRRSRGSEPTTSRRNVEDWSEPINVERELDDAWGGRLSEQSSPEPSPARDPYASEAYAADARDYAESDGYESSPYAYDERPIYDPESGRRTVVIHGRGSERGLVSQRRRRPELAFHERVGLSPDRTARWAVLLGLALLIGCVIH